MSLVSVITYYFSNCSNYIVIFKICYLTLSYFNDILFFASMDLVYIHFRNFNESYKTLTNTSIQICHIKFSGSWVTC